MQKCGLTIEAVEAFLVTSISYLIYIFNAKIYSHVIGSYPQPVTFQEGPHTDSRCLVLSIFQWRLWQGHSSKFAYSCLKKRGIDPQNYLDLPGNFVNLTWCLWHVPMTREALHGLCHETFPSLLLATYYQFLIVFLSCLYTSCSTFTPLPALILTKQP